MKDPVPRTRIRRCLVPAPLGQNVVATVLVDVPDTNPVIVRRATADLMPNPSPTLHLVPGLTRSILHSHHLIGAPIIVHVRQNRVLNPEPRVHHSLLPRPSRLPRVPIPNNLLTEVMRRRDIDP